MENFIKINNLQELKDIAVLIARSLKIGDVICLKGDLGTGKTTFAKYMIQSVCDLEMEVTSPTFNILHTYNSKIGQIWHFDLYRLQNIEEVYELGIEDAFNAITIIEWPELIEGILPNSKIDILLEFNDNESSRNLTIKSTNSIDNITHEKK